MTCSMSSNPFDLKSHEPNTPFLSSNKSKMGNISFNLDLKQNTKHMRDNNNYIGKNSNRNPKSFTLEAFQYNSIFLTYLT